MTNYRWREEVPSDDKSRASFEITLDLEASSPFKNTSQSHDGLSHSQVCIVTPTCVSTDLTHGLWTNGFWLGTLSLLALHAERLQWIHFQLDQYSILLWLESVDGCCCWFCWKPIYSNLWEFKLATSLKFTTYDFKADWFVTDSSREALNTRRKPKTERDPSSRIFQKHLLHRDFKQSLKLHLLNSVVYPFWG